MASEQDEIFSSSRYKYASVGVNSPYNLPPQASLFLDIAACLTSISTSRFLCWASLHHSAVATQSSSPGPGSCQGWLFDPQLPAEKVHIPLNFDNCKQQPSPSDLYCASFCLLPRLMPVRLVGEIVRDQCRTSITPPRSSRVLVAVSRRTEGACEIVPSCNFRPAIRSCPNPPNSTFVLLELNYIRRPTYEDRPQQRPGCTPATGSYCSQVLQVSIFGLHSFGHQFAIHRL